MTAEQLRKSILQLAIQGKLVKQDPNDEPASVLLEKIRAEKQKLIKEGKIKKDKCDSVIFKGEDNCYYEKSGNEIKNISEEVPFEIPDSWAWCRIRNACFSIFSGKTPVYSKTPTNHTIIGQQANQWSGINLAYIKYATDDFVNSMPIEYYLKRNDVLLNTLGNGTLGRSGYYYLNDKILTDGHLFVFRTIGLPLSKYLYYNLQTKYDEINKSANGSTNQTFLNLTQTMQWFFPLPPLAEQERIVAEIEKYEPLIAEYDKLEKQATKLDSEIKDKLKKSILQYAIQGKLVPQDKNDEPASVLLERIRAEKKAKLGKKYVDSHIYKGDDNCYYEHTNGKDTDITADIPFDLPENWSWCRIENIACLISGKQYEETSFGNLYVKVSDMNLMENNLKITCSSHYCRAKKIDFIPCPSIIFPKRGGAISTNKKRTIEKSGVCIDLNTMAMHPYVSDIFNYMLMWFQSVDLGLLCNGSSVPQINNCDIYPQLIPIPPLAEQHRIVEKTNSIFATL